MSLTRARGGGIEHPLEVAFSILKLSLLTPCLCVWRRPYEGFYLGCESCQGWFHPGCIGLDAEQAEAFGAEGAPPFLCLDCNQGALAGSGESIPG